MKKIIFIIVLAALVVMPALSHVALAASAEWTFMVFLNGDNDLDRFSVEDMREMEKVAFSDKINILVQVDRDELPARRYHIKYRQPGMQEDDWGLVSENLQELGEIDMGDYRELVNFFKWSAEKYPAKKYAMVIWNHGNGWAKNRARETFRGVSFDYQSGNNITTVQLAQAMYEINSLLGKKLDVLAMDACLMQMMEIAYEIKEFVGYYVASEEVVPGKGWPYDLVLDALTREPGMTPGDFSKLVCQAYAKSYPAQHNTTMSALDCEMIGPLADSLDALCAALIESVEENRMAMRSAINSVQYFDYKEHIDFGNMIEMIRDKTPTKKVREAAERTLAFFSKAVIQNNTTGQGVARAAGLAIYFPKFVFSAEYTKLAFSKLMWDDMVKTFINN